MTRLIEEEIDAGDVLIVGAGVTGTLLARRLMNDGRSVTVIDGEGFGAGQSGHSHGYLHQGYIYRSGEKALTIDLQAGANQWRTILAEMNVAPVTSRAHICFLNEITARAAASAWREAGLRVCRVSPEISGLRHLEIQAAFQTDEATYDFTPFFVAAQNALGQCTLKGRVIRLERRGDAVRSAIAQVGQRRIRLKARFVALAAGDQNARLAETATRFRGRMVVRSSLMLVARHSSLPEMSVVMPENEAHGLFVVSRPAEGGRIWLVSNFVSFAEPELSSTGREAWLGAVLQRLALYCTGIRGPEVQWGLYDAPKAELRSDPRSLGAHALEEYAISNLVVLAPTKLTLAPLLSAEAAEMIDDRLDRRSSVRSDLPLPRLEVYPERWTSLSLLPRDEFFSGPDRSDHVRMLLRNVRARSTFV
jgi:glycine/D-amino acid oxidase-like deaminating enzyme